MSKVIALSLSPCCAILLRQTPILRDLPYTIRMKLVFDTHRLLLRTLAFFDDFDIPVITEIVYRLKPMQLKRKVRFVCARESSTRE